MKLDSVDLLTSNINYNRQTWKRRMNWLAYLGDVEMQRAKDVLPNDAQPSYYKLNPRSHLLENMSTSTEDNPSGSALSTGAIVGIVIGSIFGAIILIGVVFLLRHFLNRFPSLPNPADKFSVSYTRSDLNTSTLDRNASSSVDSQSGSLGQLGGKGDVEMTPSVSLPSFKSDGKAQDTPDGSESYHAIQINFPDSREFSNQKHSAEYSLPSKASKIGTDNPCFDSEDDKLSSLSAPTPTKSLTPTITISQPNSQNNSPTPSALRLNASYAQERSNLIRRSYHLDRNVASAIAAQRNRETTAAASVFNGSEFPPNRNDDVIIVFTARTVL